MVATPPSQTANCDRFDALVRRLEDFARRRPGTYKVRVGLLAVLGYLYIFLVLVLLLALAAASIGLLVALVNGGGALVIRILLGLGKLSILLLGILLIPLFMVWDLVRSLWVNIPPPTGVKLHRREVPELFAVIDQLTTQLQAPRFDHVLLTPEFNAGVVQRPRLGLFGWYESYLLLGLPLMQAVPVPQFQAILAHELGHLSGNHSRFAGWIYRLRQRWMQLLERFQQNGGASMFNWFLNWYAPFFNAYSFVLARMDEYEADRCAARVSGAQTMAEALINVQVTGRFLQESFWTEIYQQVEQAPDPPAIAYTSMLQALRQPTATEQRQDWLTQALAEQTNNSDTHPCLGDRLQALGYAISQQPLPLGHPLQPSAAMQLLGDRTTQFVTQFDRDWQQEMATPWRQRFAYVQELSQQLHAVEQTATTRSLTSEEAWTRAYCILELKGMKTALPFVEAVLETDPDHMGANYTLGQYRLQMGDAAGIPYLERAMARDIEGVIPTCLGIAEFLRQQGNNAAATTFEERAKQHHETLQKAQQERADVSDRDRFKPHTLAPEYVDAIQQQIATHAEVKEAYLVEKVLNYFPERRFCIIGIVRKTNLVESENAAQNLVNQLIQTVQLPIEGYIIVLNHNSSGQLKNKIPQVERSLIFRRSK